MATVEQKQLQQVEELLSVEDYLNDWERTFIADIHGRLCSGESLSDEQTDKLNEISQKIDED